MYFAAIYKQRGKDLWVVVQGQPLGDDDSTDGEVVYKGPGKIRIAELVRECFHTFRKSERRAKESLNPAIEAFGYTDRESLGKHTDAITFWHIDGDIWGFVHLGMTSAPDWHLEHQFAYDANDMDESYWPPTKWDLIRKVFEYTAHCDR